MSITKKFRSELILLSITFIWGISFSLMRNVIQIIPEIPFLALRFLIGGIALLLIFRKRLKGFTLKLILQGVLVGATLYVGMALQVFGLAYTSATNSAFITGFSFIFVPIISVILLKKFPSKITLFGVMVAALGLYFLSDGMTSGFNFGDAITLISTIVWAFQIIAIDKFAPESDCLLLGIIQVLSAAIMFLITWVIVDRSFISLESPFTWLVLLWTGVGGTAFAFAAQTIVQKNTSPTHTAVIFTMEPVFAVIFAMIIPNINGLTEKMTLYKAIGCALIFSGMIFCELSDVNIIKFFSVKSRHQKKCVSVSDE